MRITGGAWASRRVAGPGRDAGIRPTPDALREQGFGVLSPVLRGAVFLDLFAGTGVVALEALSRGASRVLAVESSPRALAVIRRNAENLGAAPTELRIVAGDARRVVRRLAEEGMRASVAWCDPPFAAWADGVEALVAARICGLLDAGALVVLEHPERATLAAAGFEEVRRLRGALLLRAV